MRRHLVTVGLLCLILGAVAAVVCENTIREAWARGPNRLHETAGLIDSAQSDVGAVQAVACRYDTTPVSVGDGDLNAPRCAQTGELIVAPVAGGFDVNLAEVLGTATNVNGGNRDVATQTVTLADDDPNVTNTGTIAGDTTSLDTKVPTLTLGGGAEAGALLVTIANDSTGLVEAQGDQVDLGGVARSTLACDADDSDGPTTTLDAATVQVLLSNADQADDICITFGTGGGGDTTDPTTCDLLIGPWAGSGTIEKYELPSGFRYGGEAFRCEAPAGQTANLVVTQISTE